MATVMKMEFKKHSPIVRHRDYKNLKMTLEVVSESGH